MRYFALLLIGFSLLAGCSKEPFSGNQEPAPIIDQSDPLMLVSQSERKWSGVAVTLTPRTFVNFDSMFPDGGVQVAEIVDGEAVPYPNEEWNQWDGSMSTVSDHWVSVDRVVTDGEYRLWVLDSGRGAEDGVMEGAAKLVLIQPATRSAAATYVIEPSLLYGSSHLSDVRIDSEGGRAYIVDGGVPALIVIDLDSGEQWRLLDHHPGHRSAALSGHYFQQTQMTNLALDEGEWLYFANRFGTTLYRVPVDVVRGEAPTDQAFVEAIEVLTEIGPIGGLTTDELGRVYYTDSDSRAIRWYAPGEEMSGTLLEDDRLLGPTALACQDDALFVMTGRSDEDDAPQAPYLLYRIEGTMYCP